MYHYANIYKPQFRFFNMKCELEIKGILGSNLSAEGMANAMGVFMSWDKEEIIATINKYGCSSQESKTKFIEHFWGKAQQ